MIHHSPPAVLKVELTVTPIMATRNKRLVPLSPRDVRGHWFIVFAISHKTRQDAKSNGRCRMSYRIDVAWSRSWQIAGHTFSRPSGDCMFSLTRQKPSDGLGLSISNIICYVWQMIVYHVYYPSFVPQIYSRTLRVIIRLKMIAEKQIITHMNLKTTDPALKV